MHTITRRIFFSFIFLFLWCPPIFAAPAPEAFGQLKLVHDASISPDGELIAMIENTDGKYSVRITDLKGNVQYRDLVRLQHDVKPLWVKWANNERVLVGIRINTLIQKVPAQFTYIFTQSIHEDKGSILVDSRGIKRQFNANVLNFMMEDPIYILMSVDNKITNTPEVRKVNVSSGKFIKVEPADKDITTWYADLEGKVRIGIGVKKKNRGKSDPDYEMRIREAGSNAWQDQSEYPGLDGSTTIFGFSEDPNEVLIGQYDGKNTLGLYGYSLTEKKISRKLLHHDVYDVEGPIFSGDGKRLVGVRFQSETQETVFLDEGSSTRKRRDPGKSNIHYRFLDQSENGGKILYEISASDDSGYIGLFDRQTGEITKMADQYPGLANEPLGKVFPVTYDARDGFNIPAYITLPPGLTSLDMVESSPFIILPHGGPYARQSDQFDYFAQFFAAKGFAVLQMNFRGSTGYGKNFEKGGRENWELMLEDVEDGARWLQSEGMSKPSQTCIAGWSFGGYAALMGAVRNNDLYKCAISVAGVTDLNDLVNDQLKYVGGRSRKNSITSGFNGRKDMRRMSPVENGDTITMPVFLAHGTFDQRVHFDQFKRMEKKLKKAKIVYVAKEFEGEDHFISIEANRQNMFQEISKFLDDSVGKVK